MIGFYSMIIKAFLNGPGSVAIEAYYLGFCTVGASF